MPNRNAACFGAAKPHQDRMSLPYNLRLAVQPVCGGAPPAHGVGIASKMVEDNVGGVDYAGFICVDGLEDGAILPQ